jgi:hypothetical protein
MIFNDAAVQTSVSSIREIRPLLVDVAKGIADLVSKGTASAVLRMTRSWDGYHCADDGSLWDLLCLMQRERREIEETRFLMRLSMKAPLLVDLPNDVVNRFLGCEPAAEEGTHAECLVLCAHLLGIAISLPLQPRFDRDQLLIRFQEMTSNLDVIDSEETIDNLARAGHAAAILARDRRQLLGNLTFNDLWTRRTIAFPNLTFGLDIEEQLRGLNPGLIGPVLKRLNELNDAAEEWPRISTPAPQWRSLVSPESNSLMNNVGLRNCRVFRNSNGQPALFEWHARFGASHRIHLRFDRATFRVEIGYIGGHLPLV